jgi:hypothetical protein
MNLGRQKSGTKSLGQKESESSLSDLRIKRVQSPNFCSRAVCFADGALTEQIQPQAQAEWGLASPISLGTAALRPVSVLGLRSTGSGTHQVLNFPFTLHQLRHACATHMLQAGASIRDVQELLGHRELASTEIYTHLTPTRLRDQHYRCHPRFRPPFR